jgi:putative inorganic carbon (HCO3(-)) transporter
VLRLGIFLAPLAFLPHIVDNFVLPKLILARLLVILLTSLLLVDWARQGAITWKRTPLDLPLLAFVFSAALSTVFAINSNVAIFGTYGRWEGLLTIINYALLFWLAVQFTTGESDSRALTWSLLISGYFIAVAAVLQAGFGVLGGGYFKSSEGFIRADATLANPDFLGIFLAMLLPLALDKVASQRPALTRLLAANMGVVFTIGLLLTFTRAAWIGALCGVMVILSLRRGRVHAWPALALGVIVLVFIGIIAGTGLTRPEAKQTSITRALYARLLSIGDLGSGTEGVRLAVWGDTLPLIASRPIFGYGPDTFGLVYPEFQSASKSYELWDRPHEEILGVAATQGLAGALSYLWILVAFVRAFWRGRLRRGAVGLFGAWVAYEVGNQFNFSYIPTAVPFWMFAAAAIVTWSPHVSSARAVFARRKAVPTLAVALAVISALGVPAIVLPYLADADYHSSRAAPDLERARSLIAEARVWAPFEATYADQAGDLALNLDAKDNPSANADWNGALSAYKAAANLGSFAPETFRHLAITEDQLGDHLAAIAAAKRAVQLDRFDPDSQALLAKLKNE